MDSGGGTTGGGPIRSPFWRTPEESCKGLGSVSLKINTQHTLGPRRATPILLPCVMPDQDGPNLEGLQGTFEVTLGGP
jgi:hypothetical protein